MVKSREKVNIFEATRFDLVRKYTVKIKKWFDLVRKNTIISWGWRGVVSRKGVLRK